MPDEGPIVVYGSPWSEPTSPGETSHDTSQPAPLSNPGPADLWRMAGNTECNNLKEGFNHVVYALQRSKTARQLIDSAYRNSRFRVNLVTYNSADPDTLAGYVPTTGTLTYDPYVFGFGVNPDGSAWKQSGIVVFAHELAHQMLGPNREADVIALTNQVVRELKVSYPLDTSTSNRVSHGGSFQTATGTFETSFGLHPPCNNPE